jgi:hypothetical protein
MNKITLNDKEIDLDNYDPEKTNSVETAFGEELRAQKKLIYPYKQKGKYKDETKKVSRRVRHLSAREIRKEYGLMSMPYKRTGENVLWLIFNKGPITTSEISKEIGKPTTSFSGMLTEMYAVLGPQGEGYIERRKRLPSDKGFEYKVTDDSISISVEVAYQKYLTSKRISKKESKQNDTLMSVPAKSFAKTDEAMSKLEESINAVKDATSKLNVDVNVKVEVLFGIKK